VLNSLTRLGFSVGQMHEIECMTLVEYQLGMEAYALKETYRREDMALQAWFNQTVQATKGSGKHPKPAYKNFSEFYDTEAYEDDIRARFEPDYTSTRQQEKKEKELVADRWKKLQEYKKRQKGG